MAKKAKNSPQLDPLQFLGITKGSKKKRDTGLDSNAIDRYHKTKGKSRLVKN